MFKSFSNWWSTPRMVVNRRQDDLTGHIANIKQFEQDANEDPSTRLTYEQLNSIKALFDHFMKKSLESMITFKHEYNAMQEQARKLGNVIPDFNIKTDVSETELFKKYYDPDVGIFSIYDATPAQQLELIKLLITEIKTLFHDDMMTYEYKMKALDPWARSKAQTLFTYIIDPGIHNVRQIGVMALAIAAFYNIFDVQVNVKPSWSFFSNDSVEDRYFFNDSVEDGNLKLSDGIEDFALKLVTKEIKEKTKR